MKLRTHLVSLALGLAAAASAQTYYTVDTVNDVLYQINPTTGVATPVGPLGVDVDQIDLAWHNGALYGKSVSTVNGVRLYQIVTTGAWAGYAIPGGALNGGGYVGAEAAGLASNGAGLFLSYSNQPPVNFFSLSFAPVNPMTGTLGASSGLSSDIDAMGFASGQFYGMDVIAPGAGCLLYRGAASPTIFVGSMTYDTTLASNPVDLETYTSAFLIAMGQTGRNLVQVNRTTGARGTVTPITGIPGNALLRGLARDPGCRSWLWIPIH